MIKISGQKLQLLPELVDEIYDMDDMDDLLLVLEKFETMNYEIRDDEMEDVLFDDLVLTGMDDEVEQNVVDEVEVREEILIPILIDLDLDDEQDDLYSMILILDMVEMVEE